ncbi:hypothetical protein [Kribbella sp. VKM Ac-2569]|uniref:hypothetical protein n=1 Tax=Kribbella sp. VKM Ac-2569 TaxID=2512220 RepID=UPI001F544C53|nr:hypothetical protein [Kribbella sp. VKM Ac-2569]
MGIDTAVPQHGVVPRMCPGIVVGLVRRGGVRSECRLDEVLDSRLGRARLTADHDSDRRHAGTPVRASRRRDFRDPPADDFLGLGRGQGQRGHPSRSARRRTSRSG